MNLREIIAGIRCGFGPPNVAPAMVPPTKQADQVEIHKSARKMVLKRNGKVLRQYRVALGFDPLHRKQREGDGRTPEGAYTIDARNPRSSFHLSLRISYPGEEDRQRAAACGVSPGGDIYIHGLPNGLRKFITRHPHDDWTTGCVAVTDAEIREVWSFVPTGARVLLHP